MLISGCLSMTANGFLLADSAGILPPTFILKRKFYMNTEFDLKHETPHFGKQMLAAAADGLRKFVWVGWNKHFQNYWVSDPLTTCQLLKGEYPSFFNINNDNCIFVMEIFEGDTLIYYSKSSMSSMTVKIENGVFVGEGPFNTHPLEVYFNATDFVNMERDVSNSAFKRGYEKGFTDGQINESNFDYSRTH